MKQALQVINELKEKGLIDNYAIGGGIGALFYIEPFLTYDLDVFIIIVEESKEKNVILLTPIFEYLKSKGYSWSGEHIVIEKIPVQFIPAGELEKEAVDNAKVIEYEGIKTRVIAPEYLIAVFLRAGRTKDMEKIERFLEQIEINQTLLENILDKFHLKEKYKSLKRET